MKIKWMQFTNFIQGLLTKNIGLKLMAVFCASMFWLLVVNIDDPTQSRNFTATVKVKNEQVLTNAGKYYTLPGGNTVTFRVTARRSVIEALSGSDFKATANMDQLEDERRIPIEIEAKRMASQLSISSKTHYLSVLVGENTETSFKLAPVQTGTVPDGFAVGAVTVSPEVVYVEGPAEVISTIASASVSYDASEKTESFSETGVPKFYDAEGVEVDMTYITTTAVSVMVNVEMLVIQDVPILVDTRGELNDGLILDSITTDPGAIRLKGKPEQLNSLTTITIPQDVINLSDVMDDFETTIDIQSYLPAGISVADGESTQVRILVSVLSEDSREFKIKTSNLAVRFLSPGLTAEFTKKTVKINIRGMETMLEELDESKIAGSVDASGLTEGRHSVAVSLDLNEGLYASTATTIIEISRIEQEKSPVGEGVEGGSKKIRSANGGVVEENTQQQQDTQQRENTDKQENTNKQENTDKQESTNKQENTDKQESTEEQENTDRQEVTENQETTEDKASGENKESSDDEEDMKEGEGGALEN